MEFNEQHKVIVNTLSRIEAKAFVKFLESEIVRHADDIRLAQELIRVVKKDVIR